jgi:hypothetical protein
MDNQRALTIFFTDGSKTSFDFPKQVDNEHAVAGRLEKLLNNPYLLIEGDGVLFLFPTNNIKYIQAYPAPAKLPDTAIRGATLR